MTAGRVAAIGLVAALVAFGAAFGIGKASGSGGKKKASAPSAVTPVQVAEGPQVASFTPSGSLPAPV